MCYGIGMNRKDIVNESGEKIGYVDIGLSKHLYSLAGATIGYYDSKGRMTFCGTIGGMTHGRLEKDGNDNWVMYDLNSGYRHQSSNDDTTPEAINILSSFVQHYHPHLRK